MQLYIKIIRYSAFIKAFLEFLIVYSVGYFHGSAVAGIFYSQYYWIFFFGFFAAGMETIRKASHKDESIIALIYLLFILSVSFGWFMFKPNPISYCLVVIAALVAVINSVIFVHLESKKGYSSLIKLAVIPRLTVLILIIFVNLVPTDVIITKVALLYFVKELVELIFNYRHLNLLLFNEHKQIKPIETIRNSLSSIAYVGVAASSDPIIKLLFVHYLGAEISYVYELLVRVPRLVSTSLMHITRFTLFESTKQLIINRFLILELTTVILTNMVAAISLIEADFLSKFILRLTVSGAATINLAFAVIAYNYAIKNAKTSPLLILHFSALINSLLLIRFFFNSPVVAEIVVLYQSIHIYVFLYKYKRKDVK